MMILRRNLGKFFFCSSYCVWIFLNACSPEATNRSVTLVDKSTVRQNASECRTTILKIICDIPNDVGTVKRSYPARIIQGAQEERFDFVLQPQDFYVCLTKSVHESKNTCVQFVIDDVDGDNMKTKFVPGQWYYWGRLKKKPYSSSSGSDLFVIRLSQFRLMTNEIGSAFMPPP
jgi:hypothetical protein